MIHLMASMSFKDYLEFAFVTMVYGVSGMGVAAAAIYMITGVKIWEK